MPHHLPLISTLASALGLALILGFLAVRCRLPALVGYLLAGVLIGPFTPGFVADSAMAAELAEIGVMLLMFGVGLHFSLKDLLEVRAIAVPGAILQMAVATALGMALALAWGWSLGAGLIFGLALSVASTVVLLRALEATGKLDSLNGRIAVGWLVVEDLAMVIVLVVLPPMAAALGGTAAAGPTQPLWHTLGLTLLKVLAFIAVMWVVGRRVLPALLWQVTRTGSRELFTLCVVAAAVSIAYLATVVFGISFALGAFVAGMVLRESEFSHRAAEESLPLREAFAVLFFVSVGMLFDPAVLVEQPLRVLAVVAIVVVGKTLAAAGLMLFFRHSLPNALTVSASLAQIGEFSFILAGLGVTYGLLPPEGRSLILAAALISIALNPAVFGVLDRLASSIGGDVQHGLDLRAAADPLAELPATTEHKFLGDHVVVAGHGRVGRLVVGRLARQGVPIVVIEQNREVVERLRDEGVAAVWGDAQEPATLVQAHVARADALVIATPEIFSARQIIDTARELNPRILTVTRGHSDEEAQLLRSASSGPVLLAEEELAQAMAGHILARLPARTIAPGHPGAH